MSFKRNIAATALLAFALIAGSLGVVLACGTCAGSVHTEVTATAAGPTLPLLLPAVAVVVLPVSLRAGLKHSSSMVVPHLTVSRAIDCTPIRV